TTPPLPSSPFSSTSPARPLLSTLSLHDALPISRGGAGRPLQQSQQLSACRPSSCPGAAQRRAPWRALCRSVEQPRKSHGALPVRSEEHTSELQSPYDLVCRLLLEKKKKQN